MGFPRFSDYSDSPAMILSPQHFQSVDRLPYSNSNQTISPSSSQIFPPVTSANLTPATTKSSRKRSRDESFDEPAEPGSLLPANGPLASKTPMYGEGIPLIKSNIGPTLFAKNQTGACYEEKLKDGRELKTKPTLQAKRQINGIPESRRKFQRRDTSSETDDGGFALQVRNKLPKSILPDPVVDQFTHLLGVGWALIGDDVGVQAAARGWARYIENHYPVSMVRLVLKSKGLDAYLAETQNGYFLFSDDLSEGQLVGSSWEICLANLQHTPVTFEGVQTLKAMRTPPAEIISPQIMVLSASPAGPVDVQVLSHSNEDICMLSA